MIRNRVTGFRLVLLMLSVLACALGSAWVMAANLTASVDRTQISINETIEFTLSIDTQAVTGKPDLSALELYFDVLSTRQSKRLRLINGAKEARTQWQLTLAPKVAGKIRIPAIEFGGAKSQPLEVMVSATSQPVTGQAEDYFMELNVEADSVYLQQQVLIKVRIYSALSLSSLQGTPMELPGATVIKLDEQQYEQIRQGRRYGVYELTYGVFPQTAGVLEIPPQRFAAIVNRSSSLFNRYRGKGVRLATKAKTIEVLPPVANFDGREWIAAQSLELRQTLSQSNSGYRVGEPITRTLSITALGLQGIQLPNLPSLSTDGVKIYPEQPKTEEAKNASGLISKRTERYGLVPMRPGPLEFPALAIYWWDTTSNQQRVARIEAFTVNVLAAAAAAGKVTASPSNQLPSLDSQGVDSQSRDSQSRDSQKNGAEGADKAVTINPQGEEQSGGKWLIWSNLAWALLCVTFAGLWWRARTALANSSYSAKEGLQGSGTSIVGSKKAENDAFSRVMKVAESGRLIELREAILAWSQRNAECRQEPSPSSLTSVASQSVDHELRGLLAALDQALYSQDSSEGEGQHKAQSIPMDKLVQALQRYRQQQQKVASTADQLPTLYPQRA